MWEMQFMKMCVSFFMGQTLSYGEKGRIPIKQFADNYAIFDQGGIWWFSQIRVEHAEWCTTDRIWKQKELLYMAKNWFEEKPSSTCLHHNFLADSGPS